MAATPTPQRADRNVGFDEENIPLSPEDSTASRQKWISKANRNRTDLNEQTIETRAFRHGYIVKRPRALHYKNIDAPDSSYPLAERRVSRSTSNSSSGASGGDREERSTDDILKQISRLDLFVVANLSATFSEQAFTESGVGTGPAILEFLLLFVPIWRVWDTLRAFCINFFVDDVIQRTFVVWILILAVVYGINAPYAFVPEGENSLRILVGTYLVTRASFLVANGIQAFFIPFLRRQFLFKACTSIAASALWIGSLYVRYPAKIGLLIAANVIEHPADIFLASPVADKYLTPGYKRATHIDHYVDRHEGFFIIILGEGVFRLVEGSPSGFGLNAKTGVVITALLMYYLLHWLYFNGDHTKQFVHALRRTWWKPVLWQMLHVFMFGSLLILAASTLFLVEHPGHRSTVEPEPATLERCAEEGTEEAEAPKPAIYAIWAASATLAIVIALMTCIALLNRSLDKPKTLLVNSRWIRMAPRLVFIIIVCCLPLITHLSASEWCGGACALLYALFLWEWVSGLERNWHFLEPKNE
ncbi:hypothetical protein LSUE1_G002202 [Lachnellula suecica]|uniref:Low temperature requirement protein A n=1 Tax=Lachnellula suecica TaxID=602035 RepID=A0A8T9CCN1_9HELO|nr:hypothetical protein LSUE1_G002202 [Lachnellula suecica]